MQNATHIVPHNQRVGSKWFELLPRVLRLGKEMAVSRKAATLKVIYNTIFYIYFLLTLITIFLSQLDILNKYFDISVLF